MTENLVNIVVPLYKNALDADEEQSLARCLKILGKYPITFAKPASLDLSALLARYPQIRVVSFADSYFQNIQGYNALMMSADFYQAFDAFKYVLIYQLDAYVFTDELATWCARDYDYIGAPWLLKAKYDKAVWRLLLPLKALMYALHHKPNRPKLLGNQVGNGGFSLRKVAAHLHVVQSEAETIQLFLKKSEKVTEFNEDVFWATQVPQFSKPNYAEAALFAFDLHPERALALTGGRLPFGCHGWSKPERRHFWESYIREVQP